MKHLNWWVIVGAFLIGWIIGAVWVGAADETQFIQSFTLGRHTAWDSRDIKFIELKSGKGTVLLSGDGDLDIIKSIERHIDERVIVTIDYVGAK